MFNEVTLVGNLGQDVDLRFIPSGRAVADLNIATNERWTDSNGQRQERTVWVRVTVWGNQAEVCAQYLSKGRRVMVKGRLEEPEAWLDREGNARATLKVTAQRVLFLDSNGNGNEGNGAPAQNGSAPVPANGHRPVRKSTAAQPQPDMEIPFGDELADDDIPW